MEASSNFGIVDYAVFSLMLIVSATIGVYYRCTGGRQQTNKEYLMADKNMNIFPVTFSLMSSFMSAVTLLGVPREIYVFGTQFAAINLGYVLGNFFAAFLYLPVFFKIQKTSVYEYLELRFGRSTRVIVSATFIFQRILGMSVVMYGPAIALSAVAGFSEVACIISVGLVCTFYSTIGGMKAILWTDVFQSFLMFATVLAVIIKGVKDSNRLGEIWSIAVLGERIKFFDFNPDPTVRMTFWTQVIGGAFNYLIHNGVSQTQVQRLLTVKSLRKSQAALFFNVPLMNLMSLTSSFVGLVIYSKYYDCDPLMSKRILKSDQLLPIFIVDFFSHLPGMAGFLVSGIFSASLSSVSSIVNSLAAVTLEDFIKPNLPLRWQRESIHILLAKVLACMFGILCIALSFVINQFGGLVQMTFTILGITGGPIVGIFTLGMLCPRIKQRGAIFSFVMGIAIASWIGFGANFAQLKNPTLPVSTDGCPSAGNGVEFTTNNVSPNLSLEISDFESTTFNQLEFPDSISSINFSISNNKLNHVQSLDRDNDILYVYRVSFMWYAPLSFIIVITFGMLSSLCEKQSHVNPELLSPVCRYWHTSVDSPQCIKDEQLANTSLKKNKEKTYTLVPLGTVISTSDSVRQTNL